MCGIAGLVRAGAASAEDEALVATMTAALTHRGPDASGQLTQGQAVFGHRRLSIVERSELGAQPMVLEGHGAPLLTYNGEVYRHRELRAELEAKGTSFRGGSDTEVVLRSYQAWGAEAIARLDGMFALAIFDAERGELLLARDRFGQKPLYYALRPDGSLVFASELRALLPALPDARVSRSAVAAYLTFDGFPAPQTVIEGVRQLPPATRLSWRPGGEPRLVRYWERRYRPSLKISAADAERLLWEGLVRAVERRLMSDVPLGVFLSGGLDSSAVLAAMASRVDPRQIRTFAIGFEEASYDESQAAAQVARHFGTKHRVQILNEARLLETLETVSEHSDEPLADASLIPTSALCRFAREEVTVALGGDGGDELLAGYDTVLAERAASAYLRTPARIQALVARGVARLPASSHKQSLEFRARRFLRGLSSDRLQRNLRWFGSFLPEEAAALVHGSGTAGDLTRPLDELRAPSGEEGALEFWAGIYLPTCVLTKVDRASMAVGLEARAPFLDHELSEFLTALPYEFKLRGFARKWLLKRALRGRIPDQILRRPKQGFGVPCGEWLRGPLREEAEARFEKSAIDAGGLLDGSLVAKLWRAHASGQADRRKELWSLFVLLRWLDRWKVPV